MWASESELNISPFTTDQCFKWFPGWTVTTSLKFGIQSWTSCISYGSLIYKRLHTWHCVKLLHSATSLTRQCPTSLTPDSKSKHYLQILALKWLCIINTHGLRTLETNVTASNFMLKMRNPRLLQGPTDVWIQFTKDQRVIGVNSALCCYCVRLLWYNALSGADASSG